MLLRTFAVALVAMCTLLASQTAPQPGQTAPNPGNPLPTSLFRLHWLAYQIIRLQRESSSARLLGYLVRVAAKLRFLGMWSSKINTGRTDWQPLAFPWMTTAGNQ